LPGVQQEQSLLRSQRFDLGHGWSERAPTLSLYGVGFDPLTVPHAMNRTFRLIHSKRGRRITARLGLSRDDLLSLLLGVWIGEVINRSDEASNATASKPQEG
jgi:hypothetical protein